MEGFSAQTATKHLLQTRNGEVGAVTTVQLFDSANTLLECYTIWTSEESVKQRRRISDVTFEDFNDVAQKESAYRAEKRYGAPQESLETY